MSGPAYAIDRNINYRVNRNGKTTGITQPRTSSQEAALRRAYEVAKIKPEEVTYFECHGTGTTAGDGVEIELISKTVGPGDIAKGPIYFGSVIIDLD